MCLVTTDTAPKPHAAPKAKRYPRLLYAICGARLLACLPPVTTSVIPATTTSVPKYRVMPGRSPKRAMASTAENTGAAAPSGAARDAPIIEIAVKFRVRANG